MTDYKTTIGLEIHAELKTNTKMFCSSKNDPDETRPNVNICPICMGHPGTLPGINKQAVIHVLRVGAAVGGELAHHTHFDRKNYFYPDIPKGYQISQYDEPLVSDGELHGIALERIHLEEDTARSTHESNVSGGSASLVDFNRAGVPLMELVTKPVMHTAKEAGDFARELQLLLRTLGASDANMEKGEMRIEANISVSSTDELGTKVEVKNINSFKAVERAIEYEVERQTKLIESGEAVVQETRGWDENKSGTVSQRKKESSHDYRYFPDPDLPRINLKTSSIDIDTIENDLPELPWERRRVLKEEYGIKDQDVETLLTNRTLNELFEGVREELTDSKIIQNAVNYITSDVAGFAKGEGDTTKLTAKGLTTVIQMVDKDKLSSRGAKDILAILHVEGGDPEAIAEEKNLLQVSDEGALETIAEQVVEEHEDAVKEYQKGKETALKFLVGQGMRISKGSANPQMLEKALKNVISKISA